MAKRVKTEDASPVSPEIELRPGEVLLEREYVRTEHGNYWRVVIQDPSPACRLRRREGIRLLEECAAKAEAEKQEPEQARLDHEARLRALEEEN